MKTFSAHHVEEDILVDLLDEINLHCQESATTLVMLGHDPDNVELLNSLFRSVHSVKGDLGIVQITPLMPMLTALEDLLGLLRRGTLSYDSLLSDLLLTILETVKHFIEDCSDYRCAEYDPDLIDSAAETIGQIQPDNITKHESLITRSLLILDPSLSGDDEEESDEAEFSQLRLDWSGEIESDLVFFHDMMGPMERRIDHWHGRSSRQLKLALLLNRIAGHPIDVKQLTTAVYLHDIGMTLLPWGLLRQQAPLNEAEKQRLRSHIQRAVSFLAEMPQWAEARRYIFEHHERPDGQGYPQGLTDEQISDGAKVLALLDAFEAMTHERTHLSQRKRPIAHAVQEINLASGSQFCPVWVEVFNKMTGDIVKDTSQSKNST